MNIYQNSIKLQTRHGMQLITTDIARIVRQSGITTGLCNVFVRHTSCSLVIQENADPSARHDLEQWLDRLAPENDPAYTHTHEGPDDMPAHVKSSLMGSSVTVPVTDGRLALGTWQGIYLCEHRDHASGRHLVLTLWGES